MNILWMTTTILNGVWGVLTEIRRVAAINRIYINMTPAGGSHKTHMGSKAEHGYG